MKKLFILNNSKILDGFYQSTVIILAENMNEAVNKLNHEIGRLLGLAINDEDFEGDFNHINISSRFYNLIYPVDEDDRKEGEVEFNKFRNDLIEEFKKDAYIVDRDCILMHYS